MSLACGIPLLECVYLAGCLNWGCKRCAYIGAFDSDSWELANYEDFEPVPRICRVILAVYEEDLRKPLWAPRGGYGLNLDEVVKKVNYEDTGGNAPPYLIYVDHVAQDIILAIRGLNMGKNKDYRTLLNNRLGREMFDGGFVHHGLLKSAAWLLKKESETLLELIQKYPEYTVTFAGHSLGSGIAALMTLVVAKNRRALGNIPRERLRCFSIAPARCMSLNLALQYADIIQSVVLQDDFLPRTATPLQDIFGAIFCLPCMLCCRCMVDTCTSEKKKLKDPRRLYAPGKVYHIVERRFCRNRCTCSSHAQVGCDPKNLPLSYYVPPLQNLFRCGRFPPEVRASVPVDGRFEHIVLSCNATSDHSIIEIEQQSQKALEILRENIMDVPIEQKMVRKQSIARDHKVEYKAALERAVTLKVPHAFSPSDEIIDDGETDENAIVVDEDGNPMLPKCEENPVDSGTSKQSTNWNALIDRLFHPSRIRKRTSTSGGEQAKNGIKSEDQSSSSPKEEKVDGKK